MENIKKILPIRISRALDKLDKSRVYEIRLRKTGVFVNYGGKFFRLSETGISSQGFKVALSEIEEIVLKASEYSIYAVNDQIKNGYLTVVGGIRIGICGEVVDGKTIKNFSSLNIRFPHEIKGCADKIINLVVKPKGCFNTVIVSPPGCGKTTLLRDLIRQLSNAGNNVLVVDERYELAGEELSLDVGLSTDVISGASKDFAFNQGIRYMRPDIIAVDEIMSDLDVESLYKAYLGGVSIVATAHANNVSYRQRLGGLEFIERIIVLSDSGNPGCVQGVFDNKSEKLA